jgi:hypothetical protein
LQSFETEVLTRAENLAGLAAFNRELVGKAEANDSARRVVLDMDSTELPVYGEQEQSAYNGHFDWRRVDAGAAIGLKLSWLQSQNENSG